MTEALFELLGRKGLADVDSLQGILDGYTVGQLVDLDQEIGELVEAEDAPPESADIAGFDLWPNADLSASLGGCSNPGCRAERVQRLAQFAVMWADSVQVSPYFGVLHEDADDTFRRMWMLGSLHAILGSAPAIKEGIVRLTPGKYHFCETCGTNILSHLEQTEALAEQAKRSLEDAYFDRVEVHFESERGVYMVTVTGPIDILPHGETSYVARYDAEALAWLPQRMRERVAAGQTLAYEVPKRRLRESGALAHVIDTVAEDIMRQHLACRIRGTKYLTNRPADAAFLGAINDDDNFAAVNAVLAQYLQYEMPVLSGVPLRDLIELRTHDYEAFRVYRDTFKGVIKDHIAKQPAITGNEAAEIYDDMIRPKLNKMNQKLKSVRDKLSSRLRRDVIIAGGTLALGLSSGLVFPPAALSAAAAIPFAIDAAKTALERSDASDELKSDNLYFLWKVAQKSRRN